VIRDTRKAGNEGLADVYATISATGRGQFATIYELPYAYFHTHLNLDLPYAKQAIEREGVELFSAQNDNRCSPR
jgi:hypothetical protein